MGTFSSDFFVSLASLADAVFVVAVAGADACAATEGGARAIFHFLSLVF